MKMSRIIKLVLVISVVFCITTYADGWRQTEFGNWQYIENGELVKATSKVIDGVNYYFDTKGNWIPREEITSIKMSGKEDIVVHLLGKDYENRNYDTEITISMPIVSGENEVAINDYIRREFSNVIKKYFEDNYLNSLFLLPKIKIKEVMEIYNKHNVIAFGYFGGGMFNVFLDYKKMEMWALKN